MQSVSFEEHLARQYKKKSIRKSHRFSYLVSTHCYSDVLLGDFNVSDVFDIVPGELFGEIGVRIFAIM